MAGERVRVRDYIDKLAVRQFSEERMEERSVAHRFSDGWKPSWAGGVARVIWAGTVECLPRGTTGYVRYERHQRRGKLGLTRRVGPDVAQWAGDV